MDVVPAQKNEWKMDPFSGVIQNGEIWGRGALHCKGLFVMELGAIIDLVRSRKKLRGSLIFTATADEEVEGIYGTKYLIDHYPEKMRVKYLINEGGGFGIPNKNTWYFFLNTAEKGSFWTKLIIHGTPSHASVPRNADNALEKLSKALILLTNHKTRITPTKAALETISEIGGGKIAKFIFSHQRLADFALNHPPKSLVDYVPFLDAMLRPTIVPTMATAGTAVNIIPDEAIATLDCRLLPGQDWNTIEIEIERALHRKIEYTLIHGHEQSLSGSQSPTDTPLFSTIKSVLAREFTHINVIPYQTEGTTDSRFFRTMFNTIAYGFMPMKVTTSIKEFSTLIHGRNERISVENLVFCTRMLKDIVEQLTFEN